MAIFNTDYDREADDLFVYAKEKSKGSIEVGDLVLDFDNAGRLVGIEILNATKFLADCTADKEGISKHFLSELNKCEVEVKKKSNFLFIKLILTGKDMRKISCPINAPIVTERSPALAYV